MSRPSAIKPQVIERIGQIVRDRGDVELLVALDRVVEFKTEPEQAAALAQVIQLINQSKARA